MTWADTDYGYKKKITIDHTKVAGDETDFPVLVSVTDADLADTSNGGHVENSNGYDIVFYNDDEDTLLKHEIESYTNTDGTLVFWVKVKSLSSTVDTDIYIYYGKADVVVNPSSTETWDNQHVVVQHMYDETTSTILDSTSNNNDGTKKGVNEPIEANGKIDKGQYFDGTNDVIDCGNDTSLHASPFTLSLWFKTDDVTLPAQRIAGVGNYGSKNGMFLTLASDDLAGYIFDGTLTNHQITISNEIVDDTWYYATLTYDKDRAGDDFRIYLNGVERTTGNKDVDIDYGTIPLKIGYTDSWYFKGMIDEVRISNTARSANWISTMYESENAPDTFMSWDAEEVFIETSIYENSFTMQSDTYTIYITNPEWRGLDGQITKNIALFDFWSEDFSTVDKGIDSRDRHLQGVESVINDISDTVEKIWSMQNNKEEVTITRLGETINGVYIIESFDFKTIKGTNAAYSWSINLKFVRDV